MKNTSSTPLEARKALLEAKQTLAVEYTVPTDVVTLKGFCELSPAALRELISGLGLAMDEGDIALLSRVFPLRTARPDHYGNPHD